MKQLLRSGSWEGGSSLYSVARKEMTRIGRMAFGEIVGPCFGSRAEALLWLVKEGLGATCEVVEL